MAIQKTGKDARAVRGSRIVWAGAIVLAAAVNVWPLELRGRDPAVVNPHELVRAWLGMRVVDYPRFSQGRQRIQVVVREVRPGSPGAKAGVQPGDIVVFVQDQLVSSTRDVVDVLKDVPPGSQASVEVLRSGRYLNLAITIPSLDLASLGYLEDSSATRSR